MGSRERIRRIIAGGAADRCGFWLGLPKPETWQKFHAYFGTSGEDQLRELLHDDIRWVMKFDYRHPLGRPMFDYGPSGEELGAEGALAHCETPAELDSYEWPNPDYLDFTGMTAKLRALGDVYRPGGLWCPFFHDAAWFLGMENYFVKMHTHPELIHALTRRIVDFYLEANRRLYAAVGNEIDCFFLGNDFGSQQDLLISPAAFDEFILPYFRELVGQARRQGYQVMLHSCGAVRKIIPRVIDAGVQGLHPLQARAAGMEASGLARDFKGRLAFCGAVDTQDLLINATPAAIRAEVRRLKELLGPAFVVSPSHEALLPNVSPANVAAMAEAAVE